MFPGLGFPLADGRLFIGQTGRNVILVRGNRNNAMFYVAELTPT
jgi:hypothetical protein